MDWFELVASRHSVRVFQKTPVDREKLQRILEACNQAPSAGNLQAFEVYITEAVSVRRALARAAWGQDFIASAPLVLVFCSDPDRSATRYRDRGRKTGNALALAGPLSDRDTRPGRISPA